MNQFREFMQLSIQQLWASPEDLRSKFGLIQARNIQRRRRLLLNLVALALCLLYLCWVFASAFR